MDHLSIITIYIFLLKERWLMIYHLSTTKKWPIVDVGPFLSLVEVELEMIYHLSNIINNEIGSPGRAYLI